MSYETTLFKTTKSLLSIYHKKSNNNICVLYAVVESKPLPCNMQPY